MHLDFVQSRLWTPPPGFLAQQYLRKERQRRREAWRRIRDPRLHIDPLECVIGYVQSATGNSGAGSVTSQAAAAISTTAGNLLVVIARCNGNRTFSAPSNTGGDTWHSRPAVADASTNLQVWYAYNIVGNAADVVTVNIAAGSSDHVAFVVREYSGVLAASDPFDVDITGSGTANTTLTSASFSTAQAAEVAVVGGGQSSFGATFTAGNGYGTQVNLVTSSVGTEQQIFSALQTGVTATMTSDSNLAWVLAGAVFKAPGGIPISQLAAHGVFPDMVLGPDQVVGY